MFALEPLKRESLSYDRTSWSLTIVEDDQVPSQRSDYSKHYANSPQNIKVSSSSSWNSPARHLFPNTSGYVDVLFLFLFRRLRSAGHPSKKSFRAARQDCPRGNGVVRHTRSLPAQPALLLVMGRASARPPLIAGPAADARFPGATSGRVREKTREGLRRMCRLGAFGEPLTMTSCGGLFF